MGDVLSKLIFGFLAIAFFTIMPVTILSLNMEKSVQTDADTIVTDFVDNARSTATITDHDIQELYSSLGAYGIVWDIEIKHYSQKSYPSNNGVITGEYCYNTQDILQYLYPEDGSYVGDYDLKNGDTIEVTVKNKSDFVGTKLLKGIISQLGAEGTIYSHHAGVVGNYAE